MGVQKNGRTGNVNTVDNGGRSHTFSVTRSEAEQSTVDGGAYNIHSGLILLTSAVESGVFYYKHGEVDLWDITNLLVVQGPSTGGDILDTTQVRVYKNPTLGTLISNSMLVDVNSNRDFTSADSLDRSLAFKGAQGDTILNGSVHIESLVSPGTRQDFPISETLRKGNSIAVSLQPPAGNTNLKIMVAMIGHLAVSTRDRPV